MVVVMTDGNQILAAEPVFHFGPPLGSGGGDRLPAAIRLYAKSHGAAIGKCLCIQGGSRGDGGKTDTVQDPGSNVNWIAKETWDFYLSNKTLFRNTTLKGNGGIVVRLSCVRKNAVGNSGQEAK
jgi:hypothetical protein